MILWKFTFREIKNRPGRATLTLLSIVIGIAAVVAVTIGTATTNQAFQEVFAKVSGRAALEVVGVGDSSFPESVVAEIEKTPGVKAAAPIVQKPTSLRYKDKERNEDKYVNLFAMGVDLNRDKAVRDYELAEGRFFENKSEALLEAGFARGTGIKLGDTIKLRTYTSKALKTFTVCGLLTPQGVAGFKQGNVAVIPLATAEKIFGTPGEVNFVSVVLNDGANEKEVMASLTAALPKGLDVRSPAERPTPAKELVEKVRAGLDLAYGMIIALAFVTILNTFLMNVGERRRQLAVLRAIGTTRRQLIKMLLVEGLAMGLVGTILGAAAGLGGAYLLTQSMAKVYSTTMPAMRITPAPFIAAALIGPIVSVLAMFIPAWIAARISPLEGMRFVASDRRGRVPTWYVIFAILAFASTGAAMACCVLGYLPTSFMTFVGVALTMAFLLFIPIALRPLAWIVSWALNPLLRTEGRIANRQILRRLVRTSLTVGILYVAVSTAVSLGTNILDTVDDIHIWTNKTLKGDFMVQVMKQDPSTGLVAKMPEAYVDELRAIDGVSNVDSVRRISTALLSPKFPDGKQQVIAFVRDFTDKGALPLDIRAGETPDLREKLAAGDVILSTTLAHRAGVTVGDKISLQTCDGVKEVTVAATASAYQDGGMIVYMEGETARRLLKADGVDLYAVNAQPNKLDAVGASLLAWTNDKGLLFRSFADVLAQVDSMTRGLIAGLWGLLVLGLVVGAFAITNTLTMNVLEQTRELALLRVVAMTRWQVRKSIVAQALTIGAIGILTGTVGGMVGAYVINLCYAQLLGHAPVFALHPSLLVACTVIGFVVIIAAALIPAERAARLKLLIALQYE